MLKNINLNLKSNEETMGPTEEGEQHQPGAMGLDDLCVTPKGGDADKDQVSISPTSTSPIPTAITQPLSKIQKDTCLRSGNRYTFVSHQNTNTINAKRKLLKKENDKLSKEHFGGSGSKSA